MYLVKICRDFDLFYITYFTLFMLKEVRFLVGMGKHRNTNKRIEKRLASLVGVLTMLNPDSATLHPGYVLRAIRRKWGRVGANLW